MSKLELFIDMDEVLCDLSEDIRLRVNKDFNKNYLKGFNKNYWWSDYGIDRSYFEKLLNEEGLFLNLKPVEGSVEMLHKLNEERFNIHILTCPQHSNGDCFISKVKWIKEYLPFINIETNFHTTGNKGLFAKENRILIDDDPIYLQQWIDGDGEVIVFNQGWNQDFEGDRAFNWDDVYETIQNINSFLKFDLLYEKLDNKTNPSWNSVMDVDKFRDYMRGFYHE